MHTLLAGLLMFSPVIVMPAAEAPMDLVRPFAGTENVGNTFLAPARRSAWFRSARTPAGRAATTTGRSGNGAYVTLRTTTDRDVVVTVGLSCTGPAGDITTLTVDLVGQAPVGLWPRGVGDGPARLIIGVGWSYALTLTPWAGGRPPPTP
jgi:hypothetical protein